VSLALVFPDQDGARPETPDVVLCLPNIRSGSIRDEAHPGWALQRRHRTARQAESAAHPWPN
jgi:hypothetical protein